MIQRTLNRSSRSHYRAVRVVDPEDGTLLSYERVTGSESIDWDLYKVLAASPGVTVLGS